MTYSINNDHLLAGLKVTTALTTKHSGDFDGQLPDTIVIHYTGGSTLEGAVSHLSKAKIQASAHLVIGRDQAITQLVDFNKKAWHAGKSQHLNRKGLNHYSIGIEIVNAGPLTKTGDGFIASFGKNYPASEVIEATHRNESTPRYWHTYSEPQLSCVFSICEALCERYDIQHILGHEEIAPGRKSDPGPAFPLEKLRSELLENRSEDMEDNSVDLSMQQLDQGIVKASSLNFRESPQANARLLREPLPGGMPVSILSERDGWYKIKIEQLGWVKKEFIQL